MIGSLIGGALALGSSIYGGIKASRAMKNVKNNIENQQRENEDWYNRRYNEDATQRADAQRILNTLTQNIRNRNKAAAGTAAVTGGTEESVAAAKAANNEAIADAASRIAAQAESRKDNIESQYRAKDAALENQLNQMEAQKAAAISSAIGGVASAAGNMGEGIDDWLLRRKEE